MNEVAEVVENTPEAAPEAVAETATVETPGTPVEEATPSEDVNKPQKKGGVQRRIDELTREKYELKQQAELLQQQLQEQAKVAPSQDGPPLLENYSTEAEYYQAVGEWNQNQIENYQEQQTQTQQQAEQMRQAQQQQMEIHRKILDASQKYPDFQMKLNDPTLQPLHEVNQAAFEALLDSDKFADVANYLLSNQDEYYGLGSLSPVQAVKEIARLEMFQSTRPHGARPFNTILLIFKEQITNTR